MRIRASFSIPVSSRRNLKMMRPETRQALVAIRALCHIVVPLDLRTHEAGLWLAERLGFSPSTR